MQLSICCGNPVVQGSAPMSAPANRSLFTAAVNEQTHAAGQRFGKTLNLKNLFGDSVTQFEAFVSQYMQRYSPFAASVSTNTW